METRQHHLPRLLLDPNITLDVNETSPYVPYNSDSNFDSNMLIILAALLCALICALGLNTIVRCAVRCRRTFSHGEVLRTTPHLPSSSSSVLKEEAAVRRRVPMVTYGSELRIFATDCHICLGDFVEGEDLRVLPKCSHGFHAKCIDKWLESSSSCPTCRQQLVEQPFVVVITGHD